MFRIAIPSYERLDVLSEKTLFFLEINKIKSDRIDIFLGSIEEKEEYEKILGDFNYIIHEQKGIGSIRNYIRHHYKYKTDEKYVLYLDDDIEAISFKNEDEEENFDLDEFCMSMFKKSEEKSVSLWGLCPYENKYFLSDKITCDNRFIVGCFCGEVIRRDRPDIYTCFDHHEDTQFSLEYFLRDGGVLRDNSKGIITKYYFNGGVNKSYEGLYNRLVDMSHNSLKIKEMYGDMVFLKKKTSLRKKKFPNKLEYFIDIRFNNKFKH